MAIYCGSGQRIWRCLGKPLFNRAIILAGVVLAGSSSVAFAAGNCERLINAKLPQVTITSATSIPAGSYQPPGSPVAFPELPAFCRVVATVSPVPDSSIGIEVWLPVTTWNGRYLQVGNHGFAGRIYWSEMAPQLRRGFVTGATDDGHVNPTTNGYYINWALGHPVKIDDMAYRAVHELAENAKRLIADFYSQRLQEAYFDGCSDGGREGLREAHDYPADFAGIIAGSAVAYWTHAATEQLVVSINLTNAGIEGAPGAAILTLSQNAATAACDAADGVADGLINDPKRCLWDPHSLICQAGEDPATCITPAQADAIAANLTPLRDPITHKWLFAPMPRGSEFDQIHFGFNVGLAGFGLANYALAFNNPSYDGSSFDLHDDLPILDRVLGIYNQTDPNLLSFKEKGGKLIEWHGLDDVVTSPGWTTRYYDSVVQAVAEGDYKAAQQFFSLFMMPGVGHCAPTDDIGPDNIGAENQTAVSADPQHDIVSALMEWVEHGRAPKELIATKFKGNNPAQGIQMQRPLYPYPAQAIWDGYGDTNAASSFHSSGEPNR